jgi:hypothetical protein
MKYLVCILIFLFACKSVYPSGREKRELKKVANEIKKQLPSGWSLTLTGNCILVDFSDSVFYSDGIYDLSPDLSYDVSDQECKGCPKTRAYFELEFLSGKENWTDSTYQAAMVNNQKINAALDTVRITKRIPGSGMRASRGLLLVRLIQLPVFKNCRYTVMLNPGTRKGYMYYYDVSKSKSAAGFYFNSDLKKVSEMCLRTVEEILR